MRICVSVCLGACVHVCVCDSLLVSAEIPRRSHATSVCLCFCFERLRLLSYFAAHFILFA